MTEYPTLLRDSVDALIVEARLAERIKIAIEATTAADVCLDAGDDPGAQALIRFALQLRDGVTCPR